MITATAGEFTRSCSHCGSVLIFHGTDDDWLTKSITWDDTHECAA